MLKRLHALFDLAIRFNLHLLGRLFDRLARLAGVKPRDGYARFRRNYLEDGLLEITPEERDRLPEFSRCIHCGLCGTACPNLERLDQSRLLSDPHLLAVAFSRSIPDFLYARDFMEQWQGCGDCAECLNVCPTQVPLWDIARYIDRLLQAEQELKGGRLKGGGGRAA